MAEAAPAPTRLLLVRHAPAESTGELLTGRTEGVHLSEDGRARAKELAERLAALPVSSVYASPLERTRETAAEVAAPHGLEVRLLPELVELDVGAWAGRRIADLRKEELWATIQAAPSVARFPEGESLHEVQLRAVTALERVVAEHPGELVVVVSHADVIKAVTAHFAGIHLDLFQRLVVSPASVTAFAFLSGAPPRVLKLNDTGRLDDLLPPAREDSDDG